MLLYAHIKTIVFQFSKYLGLVLVFHTQVPVFIVFKGIFNDISDIWVEISPYFLTGRRVLGLFLQFNQLSSDILCVFVFWFIITAELMMLIVSHLRRLSRGIVLVKVICYLIRNGRTCHQMRLTSYIEILLTDFLLPQSTTRWWALACTLIEIFMNERVIIPFEFFPILLGLSECFILHEMQCSQLLRCHYVADGSLQEGDSSQQI